MLSLIKKSPGFTIVELAVVIVVIAILAMITTVSYNGFQTRAYNTQTLAAVKAYRETLEIYEIKNKSYPSATTYACLGREYPGDKCWNLWSNLYNENAGFMDALATVREGSPMPSIKGTNLLGILFVPAAVHTKVDGVDTNFITYILQGSTETCTVGPVVTYVGGANFSSTPPSSGQSVAPNSAGEVQCWIALP